MLIIFPGNQRHQDFSETHPTISQPRKLQDSSKPSTLNIKLDFKGQQ